MFILSASSCAESINGNSQVEIVLYVRGLRVYYIIMLKNSVRIFVKNVLLSQIKPVGFITTLTLVPHQSRNYTHHIFLQTS